MIKKYKSFILESSYSKYPIRIGDVTYTLKIDENDSGTMVYLQIDNETYDTLSIVIPETKNISEDEFFLNPKSNKKIVGELEKLGIIQKMDTKANAGGIETSLYFIS